MGHSMEEKVLKPLLHRKLKDRTLRKPLLVRTPMPHCASTAAALAQLLLVVVHTSAHPATAAAGKAVGDQCCVPSC
jgi:hypothetical protein